MHIQKIKKVSVLNLDLKQNPSRGETLMAAFREDVTKSNPLDILEPTQRSASISRDVWFV